MRVPFRLLLLGLVLAEIATFIVVGGAIGVVATLALTLLGMAGGAALLRGAGFGMIAQIRTETAAGRLPARPLLEGALKAVAALFIIFPGFLTDLIGLLLLIPATRDAMCRRVFRRFDAEGVRRPAFSPPRRAVIDLDQSEYVSDSRQDRSPAPGRRA